MIKTLVLSKDRPAQLDLLLSSLKRNGNGMFDVDVLYRATTEEFEVGYGRAFRFHQDVAALPETSFERQVKVSLLPVMRQGHDWFAFMCDDDVLFAPVRPFEINSDTLAFSLRLGSNTSRCYPQDRVQRVPIGRSPHYWYWPIADGDFAYPGSVDGDVYRTEQLAGIVDRCGFGDPTELEDALHRECLLEQQKLTGAFSRSVLCSIPVNRVSSRSRVHAGVKHPVSPDELNARFTDGQRISLDALDFTGVDSAHYEMDLLAAMRDG